MKPTKLPMFDVPEPQRVPSAFQHTTSLAPRSGSCLGRSDSTNPATWERTPGRLTATSPFRWADCSVGGSAPWRQLSGGPRMQVDKGGWLFWLPSFWAPRWTQCDKQCAVNSVRFIFPTQPFVFLCDPGPGRRLGMVALPGTGRDGRGAPDPGALDAGGHRPQHCPQLQPARNAGAVRGRCHPGEAVNGGGAWGVLSAQRCAAFPGNPACIPVRCCRG